LGGVDRDNITGLVLGALITTAMPQNISITVVMGAHAPFLEAIRSQAALMPWPTTVLVDTYKMATLMADSDLAIGASGSATWERCCLALPTLMVVLADNQKKLQVGGLPRVC